VQQKAAKVQKSGKCTICGKPGTRLIDGEPSCDDHIELIYENQVEDYRKSTKFAASGWSHNPSGRIPCWTLEISPRLMMPLPDPAKRKLIFQERLLTIVTRTVRSQSQQQ